MTAIKIARVACISGLKPLSFTHTARYYNLVINLIRKSQYFIEWTAPEMDIDNSYNGLYPAEFST